MSNQYPAGSLNLVKIEDAIYNWVYSVCVGVLGEDSEIRVIWRNQTEPLPPRPCVTLKFIDGPSPIARQANRFLNPGSRVVGYGIQMEATLSVQIFGNSNPELPNRVRADQLAIDLNSSLMRQTVLDDLKRGGVAVQLVGKPKNLTALEESRYEERSGFELSLGLAQNVQEEPATIETVNVNGNVSGIPVNKQIPLS